MKVLLSIKPEYAYRILAGEKKFEFRRRVHRNPRVRTVLIYATKPVGKVVGEFSIREIHSDHPSGLWEKTKDFAGISHGFFSEYFQGRTVGHAIEVKKVRKYRNPKDLSEFLESGVAPQSYAYVEKQK
ncbi:MAG TPA: ASCH domain-containing protein [Kiritimatiellia bacterium]|nr:ASCH domain-containing protein [Kiritimatiellia bacterium]HMP00561.1 ASCH domain-containing protein [Kiritimatiellia bacterium]